MWVNRQVMRMFIFLAGIVFQLCLLWYDVVNHWNQEEFWLFDILQTFGIYKRKKVMLWAFVSMNLFCCVKTYWTLTLSAKVEDCVLFQPWKYCILLVDKELYFSTRQIGKENMTIGTLGTCSLRNNYDIYWRCLSWCSCENI